MIDQSNEFLVKNRRRFIELREAGLLVQWADPTKVASEETNLLRATLNRYELIAIGLKEKTLDSDVYREYSRTTLVRDWIACKPFVTQTRQNTRVPTYYSELEKLAKKWAKRDEAEHC